MLCCTLDVPIRHSFLHDRLRLKEVTRELRQCFENPFSATGIFHPRPAFLFVEEAQVRDELRGADATKAANQGVQGPVKDKKRGLVAVCCAAAPGARDFT